MVIWLIGLSGAGKTTIGRELYELMRARESNTVFVDGDEVRRIFKHDGHPEAYSPAGRAANAERMAELCAWLDRQGMNVVCCCLSIFEETRAWNRRTYSRYFEVYLKVPFQELVDRDSKDLYRTALRGDRKNVVGVDIDFEAPVAPDLIIENGSPMRDPSLIAKQIQTRAFAP